MMAKTWSEVREQTAGRLDERAVANEERLLSEAVRAYRLTQLRKAQSLTQADVAGIMKVSQARVSKIERGELDSTETGTLRAYIEALGGRLRMVADFGDQTVIVG
jgi:predicted XRE-type DNA-binding protein